jgi:hypothetical protein
MGIGVRRTDDPQAHRFPREMSDGHQGRRCRAFRTEPSDAVCIIRGDIMTKLPIRTILTLAVTLAALPLHAANPHFVRADGTVNNDGEYVASFKEAGLGQNQDIAYLLSAGAGTQFTYQCYTKSNNQPQGEPNSSFPSNLSTGGIFNSGKNGQITASLTLVPEPDGGCQGNGLKLCLDYVSYQNMVLTDTTNNVATALPSLSRNFVVNGRPTNC